MTVRRSARRYGPVIPGWVPEWFRGWLRGWALLLAGLAAFGYVFGVPHLLISRSGLAWYGSPVWTDCHYLGPLGMVKAQPGADVLEECPVFALLDWQLAVLGRGRE